MFFLNWVINLCFLQHCVSFTHSIIIYLWYFQVSIFSHSGKLVILFCRAFILQLFCRVTILNSFLDADWMCMSVASPFSSCPFLFFCCVLRFLLLIWRSYFYIVNTSSLLDFYILYIFSELLHCLHEIQSTRVLILWLVVPSVTSLRNLCLF